jgi:hypothetical protein
LIEPGSRVNRAFTAASPHSFSSSCRAGPLREPAAAIASFSSAALAAGAWGIAGFKPRYSVAPRGRTAPAGATNSSRESDGRGPDPNPGD